MQYVFVSKSPNLPLPKKPNGPPLISSNDLLQEKMSLSVFKMKGFLFLTCAIGNEINCAGKLEYNLFLEMSVLFLGPVLKSLRNIFCNLTERIFALPPIYAGSKCGKALRIWERWLYRPSS